MFQSGALIDVRPESEKEKDFKFEEIASANPVNWVEKTPDQWRHFPIFNQGNSGSCVGQTEAKEMGIMRSLRDKIYVHFSATDIYSRRSNKPSPGMNAIDARTIVRKGGATLEALVPSQNMNDSEMDNAFIEPYKRDVGAIFAVRNYIELPKKDIETVASLIQTTGKGAMVWFYFTYDEWTEHPVVKNTSLDLNAPSTLRHSVTVVDFTIVNNKKCLIIEDSWGPGAGIGGQRIIDEDFYKARNYYAGYLMNFRFAEDQTQPVDPKPSHTFNKVLEFGMKDPDVLALQDILKHEGLFPTNISSTGYYGAITAKGVYHFQVRYEVAPMNELNTLQGRIVGQRTIRKLNELYS